LFTSVIDGAEHKHEPGLTFAYGDVPLPFMNAIVMTAAVPDCAALDEAAKRVSSYVKARKFPGMFFVCEDLLASEVRPQASGILAAHDLHPAMALTGMAATVLHPTARPIEAVTFRRAGIDETAAIISDLNCSAYGLPLDMGRASLPAALWTSETWGYIASVDGNPVSCAATFPIDGRLYVAFVATKPDTQRRGYAEAVMRHSLKEAARATGLTRTILHATDAGRPVYTRMGYHDTAKFMVYSPHMGS
jgi:ribosomal protein S18 acetylase RimI-like enzyme